MRSEIDEMGGTGYLFECRALVGVSQLLEVFNAARDDEYEEIVDRCNDFLQQVAKEYTAEHFTYAELEENEVDLVKLKGWLDRIRTRDVFRARGLQHAADALEHCESALEDYAARVYAEEGESASPFESG